MRVKVVSVNMNSGDTVDKDPGCVKGNNDMHKQRKKMRRSEGAVVVLEMDGTSLTVIDVWSDGDGDEAGGNNCDSDMPLEFLTSHSFLSLFFS
ncbi:hypothetical protein DY000_02061014 [Brassica cretica]|uniref:Uncharacterized protein n=1 Tax=Brassica cretica TaxID=69181 RepID=A0ABQ7B168_BRACR|nr:hypothetical protein DY000_02061014 [Brassica cretica]